MIHKEFEGPPLLRMRTMTEILQESGLAVAMIWPIRVWDRSPGGGSWVFPTLSNLEAFPTLWAALHLVHKDWLRDATMYRYPEQQAAFPELDRGSFFMAALDELKPRYIQCLFAYVTLFYALENGFSVLYDELTQLHGTLGLWTEVSPEPCKPAYLGTLRRVRNYTVVHWGGGPNRKDKINSRAGRYWGFSWESTADSLVDMSFGGISLVGADERNLMPLSDTHRICTEYLKEFDTVCAALFESIVSHLPVTIDGKEYCRDPRSDQ